MKFSKLFLIKDIFFDFVFYFYQSNIKCLPLINFYVHQCLLDHRWSWDIKGIMLCRTLKRERTQHERPHNEDQELIRTLDLCLKRVKITFWSFAIRQRMLLFTLRYSVITQRNSFDIRHLTLLNFYAFIW